MAFTVGFEPLSRFVESYTLANAGNDVLQFATFRLVIERIVGCEQRNGCTVRHVTPDRESPSIGTHQMLPHAEPSAIRGDGRKFQNKSFDLARCGADAGFEILFWNRARTIASICKSIVPDLFLQADCRCIAARM